MFRLEFALPFLASIVLLAPAQVANRIALPGPGLACPDPIPVHPVLIHDIAGSTLIGPLYRHLIVYSNGHASLSATTYEPDPGRAQTGILTPAETAQLAADLQAAGAFRLCDDDSVISDMPLTTVTVFRGGPDALAHTYSYLQASSQQQGVEDLVNQLIATKFPNF
jgi:hypothetical protein